MHGIFNTRKVMTCLDPKYGIMVQCKIIVYMLNLHEMMQPKLRNLEILTNDHDKSETQSDKVEELIHIETEEFVLNESTSQPVTPEEINKKIESNENKMLKQREVEIEPRPGSIRKVECTHCRNYMYM